MRSWALPSATQPAEHRPSPLGPLVWQPSLYSRNTISYLVAHRWRRDTKDAELQALKRLKLDLDPAVIRHIAEEIVDLARKIGPAPASVVPIACGHSKRDDCLSFQLASSVAELLGATFAPVFTTRPAPGSSHPKANLDLPPLEMRERPAGPALLVDDVATSGWHLEEALTRLRTEGVPCSAIAWLGGVTGDCAMAT